VFAIAKISTHGRARDRVRAKYSAVLAVDILVSDAIKSPLIFDKAWF